MPHAYPDEGLRHHYAGPTCNFAARRGVPDCIGPPWAAPRAGRRGGRMSGTRLGRAVVVGGGLAGITSALELADAGLSVTLIEGRPRLGGLAFSFRRGDLTVDNGQHVYLRCCTAYRWFLDRVGGAELAPVQAKLDVPVLDVAHPKGPRLGRLRRAALPVPLHLARSLATYPHLSLAERASVGRAALALKRLDPADPALDGVDFATWLGRHGQSARTIEALWDLVGVATLNATAPHASLGLAAMVFKTGLLSEPGAADIGWARVPLGELHDTLARKALDSAGVRTETRTKAESISRTAGRQLAGPGWPARRWTPRSSCSPSRRRRRTTCCPTARSTIRASCSTSAPRRSSTSTWSTTARSSSSPSSPRSAPRCSGSSTGPTPRGSRAGGQYLAISQSAAEDEIDLPVAELRARYLPELEKLLPAARGAEILDFFVTRERTATFAPTPGVGRLRPSARTRAHGLYLAGAWTATGWPATMEGAVRSGFSAAGAALGALGRPHVHPLQEAA